MVLEETPEYLEQHETRIEEALEQNPDELIFKTTLEPGKGNTEENGGGK